MKMGAENRPELILASVLIIVVLVLIGRWVVSWKASSPPAVPAPVPPVVSADAGATAGHTGSRVKKKAGTFPSLDPRLTYSLLILGKDTEYVGTGRNIFRPLPIKIPRIAEPPVPDPPPLPLPQSPSLPSFHLRFFGFANSVGGTKRIFLLKDDDVFIACEGDIIDYRYKIVRVTPMSAEIEDVMNNNQQKILLTRE
jgi:hypothetical protein